MIMVAADVLCLTDDNGGEVLGTADDNGATVLCFTDDNGGEVLGTADGIMVVVLCLTDDLVKYRFFHGR